MITMGYEAKGDATNDVAYYLFDKNGKKLEECWIKTPYVGMMHDMAASDNWVIFVLIPLETRSVEELEKGEKHFAWSEDKPLTFGILPRRNPKPEDVKWFTYGNAFYGHTGNAFDGDDGCVYLDAPLTYYNKVAHHYAFFYKGKADSDVFIIVLVLSSQGPRHERPLWQGHPSNGKNEPLRSLEVRS
jgi:carotenoid cleavage dioxygenase-like enzyme